MRRQSKYQSKPFTPLDERPRFRAVRPHAPQHLPAGLGHDVANEFTVRRPAHAQSLVDDRAWIPLPHDLIHEQVLAPAVPVGHVDLGAPVPRGDEDEPLSVRGPVRIEVDIGVEGDLPLGPTVQVVHPDLAVPVARRVVGDRLPIRREAGSKVVPDVVGDLAGLSGLHVEHPSRNVSCQNEE